jgi:hypothetical protein
MKKKIPEPPTPKFRPSSLPMLGKCPKFEGKPSTYTDEGTERHDAFAEYFRGNKEALEALNDEFLENMEWAVQYVETRAAVNDYPLEIEQLNTGTLPNGMTVQGTPDLVCGPDLFDLKWRFRYYDPQMACDAFMVLERTKLPDLTTHVLYANNQAARSRKWTIESAWKEIEDIITMVESAWATATPCEYCGWCARNLICEALIQQVNTAIAANPDWNLPQWHSSEIKTGKDMGLALRIARTLSDWCESVEFHAREMALKEGMVPEGFNVVTRAGGRYIDEVMAAYNAIRLPQDEFLKACAVKPKALFDAYALFHGMKKAPAERDCMEKLGPLVKRKPNVVMLVQDKPKKKDK